MNVFRGRVNRKTYIFGMGVILATTLALMIAFLLPLAAIELVVPAFRDGGPAFVDKLALVLPTAFLVVGSFSLLIRRAHDIGSDGLIWLTALFIGLAARVMLDSALSGILPMLVLMAVASIPGDPKANRYGKKPKKKFTIANVYQS
jgi:uncharacterized membrane protein YhaH (DUF805 family)